MDGIEMNVDKQLMEREKERDSEDETEQEVCEMLEEYNLGTTDREGSLSHPKLELITHTRPHYSTLHTMDIPSVRYRPAPVLTQAELTSTYGHPRLELPEVGRIINSVPNRTQDETFVRLPRVTLL